MSTFAECETLDAVPQERLDVEYIERVLVKQLQKFPGAVWTGAASPMFASALESWGRAVVLHSGESLFLRVHPKGAWQMLARGELPRVVIVAMRRRGAPTAKDVVAFGVFWHPAVATDRLKAEEQHGTSSASVGARHHHLMTPALFTHHEPNRASGARYPHHDSRNYHVVRPRSFSLRSVATVNDRAGGVVQQQVVSASAPLTHFCIAGEMLDVDVPDVQGHTVEAVEEAVFHARQRSLLALLQRGVPREDRTVKITTALANALLFEEMLCAEGLLGLLSTDVLDGSWPDALHLPGGFPLVIACAARLACHPTPFGLPQGTRSDEWANAQLRLVFEAQWEPLPESIVGNAKNIYAIDLVIRRAFDEAGQEVAARLGATVHKPASLHALFLQRAGQRLLSQTFGPFAQEFQESTTGLGRCRRLGDASTDARRRVLRRHLSAADAQHPELGDLPLPMGSQRVRRQQLFQMLDSVEHYLRTGTYAGVDLGGTGKTANPSPLSDEGTASAAEVRAAVESKLSRVEAAEDALVRQQIGVVRAKLDTFLEGVGDKERVRMPTDVELGLAPSTAGTGPDAAEALNPTAVVAATNTLRNTFVYGPVCFHELGMHAHPSHPDARLLCADCDAEVHLVHATLLGSSLSKCATCSRPRCLSCARAAAHASASGGCRRCKASKPKKK